jgi:hypothetical protein
MQDTKCLIITYGYFGDILFASSLAKKLNYNQIDYLIGFPQIQRLLQNNPYINKVYISEHPGPVPVCNTINYDEYTRIISLQPLNFNVTPCEEFQQFAGIENPSPEYEVYTQPEFDNVAQELCSNLRKTHNKPVVAVLSNWKSKTYRFTPEQYEKGIDVPNLGYGGAHRNINFILNELEPHLTLIPVGVGELNHLQTLNIPDEDTKSLLFEASLIKHCNAFIGAEGGLANLAAGVGTKTILTSDFVHQLYGWNGVLKKIKEPKLGPKYYFKDIDHIDLDPYLTDDEIIINIKQIIKQNDIRN